MKPCWAKSAFLQGQEWDVCIFVYFFLNLTGLCPGNILLHPLFLVLMEGECAIFLTICTSVYQKKKKKKNHEEMLTWNLFTNYLLQDKIYWIVVNVWGVLWSLLNIRKVDGTSWFFQYSTRTLSNLKFLTYGNNKWDTGSQRSCVCIS